MIAVDIAPARLPRVWGGVQLGGDPRDAGGAGRVPADDEDARRQAGVRRGAGVSSDWVLFQW
ncbi:hypothetical protein [Actinophytocola glycyrrhizae]|uniref:Uncharacterized protein n=1 Tax=Actinophytocola glycyrrhizae TaxID=2044873 RepID=A0ABV9S2Y6_9PSEU